ncbi:hypothetical protein TPA0907_43150 [Micromonospora humidisoli]|uniref:hypothetical protein n=1 Tax=Micromonospora sp. AKA109 TaxID=2733865 RepID=UPI0022C4FA25|nr:hypothetical protein [Micromonospora sp. AKA109]GHJ09948.1 hypothetical protein TPA0907_43150 [Micromonospora sp. AKA109]
MMPLPAGHAPRSGRRLAAAGVGLAALAVPLWAVGMTVWQPLTEPVGPWSERLPEASTYWARDLRFLALLAAVCGLVLAGAGRRSWLTPAVLLGGGALAADVAVDRADPTGPGATVALVVAGWLAVGITVASAVRRDGATGVDGPRRTVGPADPHRPVGAAGRDRAVLAGVAAVAAVLALTAVLTRSPTGREPALDPAALVTALLLLAVTVTGAAAAAPARGRRRLTAATGVAVTGGIGLPLVRLVGPADRLVPAALLGAALLLGVTLLTRPALPARRYPLLVPVALLAPLALWHVASLVSAALSPGAPLTALAGNSPVGGGDPDVLPALAGLVAGLGTALVLARTAGVPGRPGHRPAPPAGGSARPANAERRYP